MAGLLFHALKNEIALDVPEGKCWKLEFGDNEMTAIGTQNLRSCSAVLAVSKTFAILAHIKPDPTLQNRYAHSLMAEFEQIYNANKKKHYPTGAESWVVTAIVDGDLVQPEAKRIIEGKMTSLGLPTSSAAYTFKIRPSASSPQFPGKGTVFVDAAGARPIIYVEDVRKN